MVQDAAIITSTLFFHLAPIVVLFDFGSTHTFISRSFVDKIGVLVDYLGFDLVVFTPVRVVPTISVCVRHITVVVL